MCIGAIFDGRYLQLAAARLARLKKIGGTDAAYVLIGWLDSALIAISSQYDPI